MGEWQYRERPSGSEKIPLGASHWTQHHAQYFDQQCILPARKRGSGVFLINIPDCFVILFAFFIFYAWSYMQSLIKMLAHQYESYYGMIIIAKMLMGG